MAEIKSESVADFARNTHKAVFNTHFSQEYLQHARVRARLAAGSRSRHIPGMTLPRVQPIIPTRRKEPFDDPGWVFELKYDGFRALCYLEQGRGRFVSRATAMTFAVSTRSAPRLRRRSRSARPHPGLTTACPAPLERG